MGEIVTKFSSDDKEMTAAFQRQQREIDTLRKKLLEAKNAGEEASEAHKKGAEFIGDQVSSVKGLVTGLFTVDKLIQTVNEGYSDWADNMKSLSDRHKDFEKDLIRTIAKAGQLANASFIEQQLGNIPGATKSQGATAWAGVYGAAPSMSTDKQLAIARQIAPAGASGIDLGEFGNVAGKIAELMPGKSPEQVADIVAALQQKTGADFGAFGDANTIRAVQSLVSSGAVKSPEEALGLGVSAHGANLKPGILSEIARATTEPVDQAKLKSSDMAAFSRASPEQRMEMLRGNAAVRQAMLGDNALMMQMLPGAATGLGGDSGAMSGMQQDLLKSKIGMAAASRQITEQIKDRSAEGYWATRSGQLSEMDETLRGAGVGYFGRSVAAWGARATMAGLHRWDGVQESVLGARRGAQDAEGVGSLEGQLDPQIVKLLEQQNKILEKMEVNQRQKQPNNINAHVE